MINIMPETELIDNYGKIEQLVVKNNEIVFLTKDGYGSKVVMSIDRYNKLIEKQENCKVL